MALEETSLIGAVSERDNRQRTIGLGRGLWRRVGTCLQISYRIRSARRVADRLSRLKSTLARILLVPAGKRVFPRKHGEQCKGRWRLPDCRPEWWLSEHIE